MQIPDKALVFKIYFKPLQIKKEKKTRYENGQKVSTGISQKWKPENDKNDYIIQCSLL